MFAKSARTSLLFVLSALSVAPVWADDVHPRFAEGKDSYEQLCAKCHGKALVHPGISSFDLRQFPLDQKARFYQSVISGKGDMPAWGDVLIEGELDALWVYVATRAGTQAPPPEAAVD